MAGYEVLEDGRADVAGGLFWGAVGWFSKAGVENGVLGKRDEDSHRLELLLGLCHPFFGIEDSILIRSSVGL